MLDAKLSLDLTHIDDIILPDSLSLDNAGCINLFNELNVLWKPLKVQSFSQFCDENFYIEGGRWKTRPAQRAILDAMLDKSVERVTILKSSRFGYTQMLLFLIGYLSCVRPAHILFVQPTQTDANDISKQEIMNLCQDNSWLGDSLTASKNTLTKKIFPHGSLRIIGSQSPAGFRRVQAKCLIMDEISAYGINPDGDQIVLGEKRTETHADRKIILGSTPSSTEDCRITEEYLNSNQQEYHMPCPGCKELHSFEWERFDVSCDEVTHTCPHCAFKQHNHHKYKMMEAGEWISNNPTHKTQGFKIWSAYSEDSNCGFNDIGRAYHIAKKNEQLLRVFTNTYLGQAFEEVRGDIIEWQEFIDTRLDNQYPVGELTADCKYVFAGVDIQQDRFEVTFISYQTPTSWRVLDHVVIHDINPREHPTSESWELLTELLTRKFYEKDGQRFLTTSLTSIDSGYCTSEVYAYVKHSKEPKTIAVRGGTIANADIIQKPRLTAISEKSKLKVYVIGTHKNKLQTLADCADPKRSSFPSGLTADYYQSLFSEKLVKTDGRADKFHKIYKQNEAFDTLCYSLYAARLMNVHKKC